MKCIAYLYDFQKTQFRYNRSKVDAMSPILPTLTLQMYNQHYIRAISEILAPDTTTPKKKLRIWPSCYLLVISAVHFEPYCYCMAPRDTTLTYLSLHENEVKVRWFRVVDCRRRLGY